MRTWHGILTALLVVATAGAASAQGPAIGVFFDTAATQTTATFEGGPTNTYTAYVYAVDTEMLVGGVAFKLNKDPRISIISTTYPSGVQIGDITSGVQVGFTDCQPGFYGTPVLVATLLLYTGTASFADGELTIDAYPRTGTIQLADCDGIITDIAGMTSYLTILPQPKIGIYFDTAATQTQGTFNGGFDTYHTAYIFAVDTEKLVGGAAFKLTMDARISLLSATFPAGVQIGTLLEGIQIGFTDCAPGFYGTPVLCSTLTLWTGANLLADAELRIDPYPLAGVIQLADCDGIITNVAGGTATLTIPVGAESDTWGQVKALYGE